MIKAKPNIRLIIFDLDGTLVDTALYIVLNYTHLFVKHHVKVPSLETMVYFSGPPLTEVFKQYFPKVPQKELLEDFGAFANKYDNIFANLYPDEIEVLTNLKKAGYLLAIVSSKRQKALDDNLTYFHLKDFFSMTVSLDSGFSAKPCPDGINHILTTFSIKPSDAFIIGDSSSDIEAGLNASIHTGLVTFGLKKKPDIIPEEEYASYKEIERSFLK